MSELFRIRSERAQRFLLSVRIIPRGCTEQLFEEGERSPVELPVQSLNGMDAEIFVVRDLVPDDQLGATFVCQALPIFREKRIPGAVGIKQ